MHPPGGLEHTDTKAAGVKVGTNVIRVIQMEQGKPVVSPLRGQASLQGALLGQRVKDAGESECRSVMERIGVATLLRCKAGRLPVGRG